jgi:transcriptional regulator with XRE-family HTH domain
MWVMKDRNLDRQLGKLFQKGRLNSGLTQASVCRMLGYSSPQFLSNFERGLCSMPLPQLKKLIDLYDLDGEEVVDLITTLQSKFLRLALGRKKRSSRAI